MNQDLHSELAVELAWLRQMLDQLYDKKPKTMAYEPDPLAHLKIINAYRSRLEAEGISVPPIADPDKDPIGSMMGWRDFLSGIIRLN